MKSILMSERDRECADDEQPPVPEIDLLREQVAELTERAIKAEQSADYWSDQFHALKALHEGATLTVAGSRNDE